MFTGTNLTDILAALAIFGLIVAVWLATMLVLSARRSAKAKKVQERLGVSDVSKATRVLRLWHEGREATTLVPGLSLRRSLSTRIEHTCREAGWAVPMRTVLLGLIGGMMLLLALGLLITGSVLFTIIVVASAVTVLWLYVKQRIARRQNAFEVQLVDALELAARSLRAGHPLLGAFRMIAGEMPPPLSRMFADICQQQELGVNLGDALREAAAESASPDMKFFATAVAIQLNSGGNLADMMERLAQVIRDRIRLYRRVRVLTAQTQFSKRILIGLPLVLFAVLNIVSPGYMAPLLSTLDGKILLGVAGAGLLIGIWMMNRLAVLRW